MFFYNIIVGTGEDKWFCSKNMSLKVSSGNSIRIDGVASKKVCSSKQGLSFISGPTKGALGAPRGPPPEPCMPRRLPPLLSAALCLEVPVSSQGCSHLAQGGEGQPGRRGRAARTDMRAERVGGKVRRILFPAAQEGSSRSQPRRG